MRWDEAVGRKAGREYKVDGGKPEDEESGKQANFYFRGLTPFLLSFVS